MERVLEIGTQRHTKVLCIDAPGAGGACHEYLVKASKTGEALMGNISFQNGPIKEVGVNGCHNENLIAIVIDRLEHFQAGPFACQENADALACLEETLGALNCRTTERRERGVEGTSEK